jgi:hypothetical protein
VAIFVPGKNFYPRIIFVAKTRILTKPYNEAPQCSPLGQTPAYWPLKLASFPKANTLAYFALASTSKKKVL